MRKYFDASMYRFIIVGVINTIVGTSIMFGLYNFTSASYWFASGMNYFLTSILSYFLNKYYTFQHEGETLRSMLRFAINIAISYFIAYGLAKPLVLFVLRDVELVVQENVAMLVGMVLFTFINYFGQRFFAFKK